MSEASEAARWERIKQQTLPLWERVHQLREEYQARNFFIPQYVIFSVDDWALISDAFSQIMPHSFCGIPIRTTEAFTSVSTTIVGGTRLKPKEVK